MTTIAADPIIVGYERIPDGNACELCSLAAGQRYKSDDLMPIHDRCGCGVEPVTSDQLLDPVKGQRVELQQGNELVGTEWKPTEGPVRGNVVRKSDDRIMVNAGTDKNPRWVESDRLYVVEPKAAVRQAKSPFDVVDVGSLEELQPTLKGQALRDHLVQPKELFDSAERKAVRDYTGGKGEAVAEKLNKSLRRGTFGPRSQYADVADGIDGAFARVEPLGEPGQVFRGGKVKFGRQLREGAVIEDSGYMSTSASRSVAEGFAGRSRGDLFEITLPRGSRALDINEAAGSRYGFEREVLLPRGTRMVVESIRHGNRGQRIVKVRVLL